MATPPRPPPSLQPEIGPDGFVRENPVIAYTEKKIEAEQLQLKRYIQENYSKIRDVERELENLTLELKLTAGPKKAALEHLRKMIEVSTERIRVAKAKEDQAKKVWEAATQVVKDEEATKQNLCDDLNNLVQESTTTQITRLGELKRRLEALNPSRVSSDVSDGKPMQESSTTASEQAPENAKGVGKNNGAGAAAADGPPLPAEKKKVLNLGRGKNNSNNNIIIMPKGRGSPSPGWTGSGFDVDGRA